MRRIVALFLLLFFTQFSYAADPCSADSVLGDWSFTVTGARVTPGASLPAPVAAVGVFTLLPGGKVTGRQRTSIGGTIFEETFTGTFSVATNCIGAATLVIVSGAPRTAHFMTVVAERADRIRMIFTDSGTISTVDATRIGR